MDSGKVIPIILFSFLFLLSLTVPIILYFYKDSIFGIMTPTIAPTITPTVTPTVTSTSTPAMTVAMTTSPVLFTTTSSGVDSNKLNLLCSTGTININSADYQGKNCSPQNNLTNIKALCNSNSNCSINILPSSYTGGSLLPIDPCPGIQKTLNVNWGCSSGTGTATIVQ